MLSKEKGTHTVSALGPGVSAGAGADRVRGLGATLHLVAVGSARAALHAEGPVVPEEWCVCVCVCLCLCVCAYVCVCLSVCEREERVRVSLWSLPAFAPAHANTWTHAHASIQGRPLIDRLVQTQTQGAPTHTRTDTHTLTHAPLLPNILI